MYTHELIPIISPDSQCTCQVAGQVSVERYTFLLDRSDVDACDRDEK